MIRNNRLALTRLLAIALAAVAAACGGNSTGSAGVGPSATVQLPSVDSMLADKVLGSASAAVTMIEYSSLGCPHCASFHAATLPQIRTAYIDTGKVRFIYRDFPLDTTALAAAMVARCSGDRYFTVLDQLYQTQATWAGSANPTSAIKAIVATAGMTGAEVDACLALADLRNGLTNMRTAGQQQYGVSGTPTFIIGSQNIAGEFPFATFDDVLSSLTQ
ncbi:MAG: DsbA family protein [Acidobacteria bacterium]|nr:DsbA family protein [Acidobacteriota bacterium]